MVEGVFLFFFLRKETFYCFDYYREEIALGFHLSSREI